MGEVSADVDGIAAKEFHRAGGEPSFNGGESGVDAIEDGDKARVPLHQHLVDPSQRGQVGLAAEDLGDVFDVHHRPLQFGVCAGRKAKVFGAFVEELFKCRAIDGGVDEGETKGELLEVGEVGDVKVRHTRFVDGNGLPSPPLQMHLGDAVEGKAVVHHLSEDGEGVLALIGIQGAIGLGREKGVGLDPAPKHGCRGPQARQEVHILAEHVADGRH